MLILSIALFSILLCGSLAWAEEMQETTQPEEAAVSPEQTEPKYVDMIFVDKTKAFSFADMTASLPCWMDYGEGFPAPYHVLERYGQAYIYSEASEDAAMSFPVQPGDPCYLMEGFVDGKWHKVRWHHFEGYLPAIYLNLTGSEAKYAYYQGQDMRTMTGYDAETLELCLSDAMVGLGEAFYQAEQDYGVNALFLISICEFESANGTSGLARNRNNLAGLGGSGHWASFSSYADCVDYLGSLLASRYLNPETSFFHGFTTSGVCQTYCGGSQHWINCVNRYLQKNFDQINNAE